MAFILDTLEMASDRAKDHSELLQYLNNFWIQLHGVFLHDECRPVALALYCVIMDKIFSNFQPVEKYILIDKRPRSGFLEVFITM